MLRELALALHRNRTRSHLFHQAGQLDNQDYLQHGVLRKSKEGQASFEAGPTDFVIPERNVTLGEAVSQIDL